MTSFYDILVTVLLVCDRRLIESRIIESAA